jgi:hypothetical protein
MKTNNEHKIEKALHSAEGMQRAEASPFLYGKIMARLKQHLPEPVYYTAGVMVRIALAALVIGLFNSVTVKILKKPVYTDENIQLMWVAQEYFGEGEVTDYNNY